LGKCLTKPYTKEITLPDEKKKQTLQLLELTSPGSLKREGRSLKHCVGTNEEYRRRCMEGDIRIFSVRDAALPAKPLSTIEIEFFWTDPPSIGLLQHRGFDNADPSLPLVEFVIGFIRDANCTACNLIDWRGGRFEWC